MSIRIFHSASKHRNDNFERLLRDSDRASFGSIVGRVAILNNTGRILCVNEAWTRLGVGEWGKTSIRCGDNYPSVLREAAATGDAYAQTILPGISSVLTGANPSFSSNYSAVTYTGVRSFQLSIALLGDRGILVIHEINSREDATESDDAQDYGQLPQLADALAKMTGADCVMISAAVSALPLKCAVVAQTTRLGVTVDAHHGRAGSPCGQGKPEPFVYCRSGVQRRYPQAAWLRRVGGNGFADLTLLRPDGEFLGHISVIHHGALPDRDSIEAAMGLFAARASLEIERLHLRRERHPTAIRDRSADVFYKNVFESLDDAVILLDQQAIVIGVNRGAELLYGRAASELVGKDARWVTGFEISAEVGETRDGRGSGLIQRPDGSETNVEVSVASMEYDGTVTRIATARELKEDIAPPAKAANEEAEVDAILDAVPDAILRIQRDGICLDSRGGGSLSHIVSPGHSVRESMSNANGERLLIAIAKALDTSAPVYLEYKQENQREERHYECRLIPFKYDQVLAIVSDNAAEQREKGRAEVEALEGQVERKVFRRNRYHLTFRELTVLRLLTDGATDKDIADKLSVSIFTVNKHVGNILGKMQATTRTEAAVRASRESLVA